MTRALRILVLLLATVFVAGTVVHAAATAAMSQGMTMSADAGLDGGACEGCSDADDASATCGDTCVPPLSALSAPAGTDATGAAASLGPTVVPGIFGRSEPPERHPPR